MESPGTARYYRADGYGSALEQILGMWPEGVPLPEHILRLVGKYALCGPPDWKTPGKGMSEDASGVPAVDDIFAAREIVGATKNRLHTARRGHPRNQERVAHDQPPTLEETPLTFIQSRILLCLMKKGEYGEPITLKGAALWGQFRGLKFADFSKELNKLRKRGVVEMLNRRGGARYCLANLEPHDLRSLERLLASFDDPKETR
jgi:hypothetical protein